MSKIWNISLQAAATCYIELIVKESDNNVKLIVLDRLIALQQNPAHEKIIQVSVGTANLQFFHSPQKKHTKQWHKCRLRNCVLDFNMGFTSRVFSRNFYHRKTAPKIKSSIEFQNSILEIVLLKFVVDRNYFSVGKPENWAKRNDRNHIATQWKLRIIVVVVFNGACAFFSNTPFRPSEVDLL